MGYRTVVLLNNDLAHEWSKDEKLGQKISRVMNRVGAPNSELGNYGKVLECQHADTQTLMVLDSLCGNVVARDFWYHGQTKEDRNFALLKEMADSMGYRLTKKKVNNG